MTWHPSTFGNTLRCDLDECDARLHTHTDWPWKARRLALLTGWCSYWPGVDYCPDHRGYPGPYPWSRIGMWLASR